MSNISAEDEYISLSFPVNAAYVSAARLTASSIASRMGFDVDEIEDIKTAVSEACTYIIKKITIDTKKTFKIQFALKQDILEISLTTGGPLAEYSDDEIGFMMIKALMDSLDVDITDDDDIKVLMVKKHKRNIFS